MPRRGKHTLCVGCAEDSIPTDGTLAFCGLDLDWTVTEPVLTAVQEFLSVKGRILLCARVALCVSRVKRLVG